MNAYEQLRKHWKHLPELPNPDNVDISTWAPENPSELKNELQRGNGWGYVDSRLRARINTLIENEKLAAKKEKPVDLSYMTFEERWAAMPDSMSHDEKLKADIAAYESLTGLSDVRIVSPSDKYLEIAWGTVSDWKPERYQPVARSIGKWGRDAPLHDDLFGKWKQNEDGKWERVGVRVTWSSMGGYDPSKGPWRGACYNYPINKQWLESTGPGPWQIAVMAQFDGRGPVYSNLVEWPIPVKKVEPVTTTPEITPNPPVEETPTPKISPKLDPVPVIEKTREEKIYIAVKTYTGPVNKKGMPKMNPLRRYANMPFITKKERNRAWKKINSG